MGIVKAARTIPHAATMLVCKMLVLVRKAAVDSWFRIEVMD